MARYLLEISPGQEQYVMSSLAKLGVAAPKPAFNHISITIPDSLVRQVKAIPGVKSIKADELSAIRVWNEPIVPLSELPGVGEPSPFTQIQVAEPSIIYKPMAVEAKFSTFLHLLTTTPRKGGGPLAAFRYAAAADVGKEKTSTGVTRQMVGAEMAEAAGITGKGIKIAVLDTGTSYDALFQGTFIGGKSSMPGQPLPWDEVGHGQWCNTCIAGRPFSIKLGQSRGMFLKGVAPGATVAAFKVLGGGMGLGFTSSILGGLQNAMEWGADIVSMSLGGSEPDDYTTEPECMAIEEMANKGIIVVVAAGNSGPGSGTINCPGNSPDALTVGAVDVANNVASFSSRGPTKNGEVKPDVVCPGVDILSTSCGYIAAMQARSDGPPSLAAISGTSMATPHASGVVALGLQYARSVGKNLTGKSIKEAMYFYGDQQGNKTSDRGWGMLTWPILKRYIDEYLTLGGG